jgi:hypothetical protein
VNFRRSSGAGALGTVLACTACVVSCRSRPAPAPVERAVTSSEASVASAPGDTAALPSSVREVVDAGSLARGIPVPQAMVDAEVNPEHLAPYDGPTGTVEGVVHMRGDPAPAVDQSIPFECAEAHDTYGRLFREGTGRTVADVMVAVTGYNGYLPPTSDAQPVTISGCAYDRRTVALMFGQYLAVINNDRRLIFLPTLLGADLPAQLVAIPRGDAVRLYPRSIGHYALADGMNRSWMNADVFVVRYRTHSVTGMDGAFRIERVPVGKVKISAYLPAIDASLHPELGVSQPATEEDIQVTAGETLRVNLTLNYKRPKPKPKPRSSTPPPDIR